MRSRDPRGGEERRHHLYEKPSSAWSRSPPTVRASSNPLPRTRCAIPSATHLLEAWPRHPHGAGIAGHKDVQTTMIYTHVLNAAGAGCKARWIGSRLDPAAHADCSAISTQRVADSGDRPLQWPQCVLARFLLGAPELGVEAALFEQHGGLPRS
ncbi:MAG: hypothetical protein U1F68_05955 [Gammaproteobacteria bacterium]